LEVSGEPLADSIVGLCAGSPTGSAAVMRGSVHHRCVVGRDHRARWHRGSSGCRCGFMPSLGWYAAHHRRTVATAP